MQEILEVIGTLPDLQQSILRMKHLEGFEVEEDVYKRQDLYIT